ncbi:pentapeptide repeat-containing protein [Micromonospora sp. NPDC047557]|uniref:pentapeptide repeat-containing protein n=1 Tax=Micromonospora sp. NPDC047557 TaxID=3364250 RepID=UPI00371189FF
MRFLKRWRIGRGATRGVASHDAPLRPMPFLPVMVAVVLVVLLGGGAAMWLLGVWSPQSQATLAAERFRLDQIKTALTVAAGLAAGVTLLMTLRRQALSERAQRFAESDALEQRTTTLYVAAADQLGSDKAAVRLAGLYALERLGQDNPKLRQTVVDVWCAYLRMPYVPPVEVLRGSVKRSPEHPSDDAEAPDAKTEAERREELQVRLTAQRLLAAQLRRTQTDTDQTAYWIDAKGNRMTTDLVGAVLVNFSFASCEIEQGDLSGAQFHGVADLSEAQFHGVADLSEAQFHGDANLSEAQFHGDTNLDEAQFHGVAYLSDGQFHGDTYLSEAQFHGGAILSGTQFHGYASLSKAQFHGYAYLSGAQFHGDANLEEAQFHGDTDLSGAQFHGDTNLDEAQFHGDTDLSGAQFHGDTDLSGAQFHGRSDLREAQFDHGVDLSHARATPAAPLPSGWILSSSASRAELLGEVIRAQDHAGASPDGQRKAAADGAGAQADTT